MTDDACFIRWISFFAVNVPLRDYQLSIAEKALFSNTLVALPTGLGKTLIAAVVMYNYFRWFPEGSVPIIVSLSWFCDSFSWLCCPQMDML